MKEQIVAKSYAHALMDLGKSKGLKIANELTSFNELINGSNDLENFLFLDVFTVEEKSAVLKEILKKGSYSPLLTNFLFFLLEEKRINLLTLIYKEVIVQDDHEQGFIRGTIEGVEESISEDDKAILTKYIEKKLGKKPQLDYKKSGNVTAGYKVTVEDLQLDASVDNQFDKLKYSILGE